MKAVLNNIDHKGIVVFVTIALISIIFNVILHNIVRYNDDKQPHEVDLILLDYYKNTEYEECIRETLTQEELICLSIVIWADGITNDARNIYLCDKIIMSRVKSNDILSDKDAYEIREIAIQARSKIDKCYSHRK